MPHLPGKRKTNKKRKTNNKKIVNLHFFPCKKRYRLILCFTAPVLEDTFFNIIIYSVDDRSKVSSKMILISHHWHSLLLVVIVEGISSTTETNSIHACKGHSVHLFSNVTIDTPAKQVHLYKFSATQLLISTWSLGRNLTINGYSKKLFLDQNGDVWIRNISPSDAAKYKLVLMVAGSGVTFEVELYVYVAPSLDCKPKIKRIENMLIASVESDDCGKPVASAYWLAYPGIHYDGNDVIKLPAKNKAGTYYACIEGPVLRCAKSSRLSEHCSTITIDDISSEPGTESSSTNTLFTFLVANLLVICGTFVVLSLNTYMNFIQFRIIKRNQML